jgi:hypothetical protein
MYSILFRQMYYALFKRKGNKSWTGAIPGKKGYSKEMFRSKLKSVLRKNVTIRIVTGKQLKNYMMKIYKVKI